MTTKQQPSRSDAVEATGFRTWRDRLQWCIPPAVVFIVSVCIMTVELVVSRMIARHVGQSLYTWTSVIGVVLAGIAVGNYIGGRLADRFATTRLVSVLLLAAAIACALIPPLNHWVGEWELLWYRSWPMRIALHVFFSFIIPATLLGTISPVCAKMALDIGRNAGRTMGGVYAWGALGSVVGTFLTGFFLIGGIGSTNTIWLVAAILAVLGLLFGLRSTVTYGGVGVFAFLAFGALAPGSTAQALGSTLALRAKPDPLVLYEAESDYSYITVIRGRTPQQRAMTLDVLVHSLVNLDKVMHLEYEYERVYDAVARHNAPTDRPVRMLMIGGGGYTFPRFMEHAYPGADVEVVEIDPAVTEAAHAAFGFPRDTAIRIHHLDARNYVEERVRDRRADEPAKSFDYVFADAVNDLSVPFHLTTREYIEKVRDLLDERGAFLMTMIDTFESAQFVGALFNTFTEVFPNVVVFSTNPIDNDTAARYRDTFVLVGSLQPIRVDGLTSRDNPDRVYSPLTQQQVALLKERAGDRVLTDDFAPVENLLANVVAISHPPHREFVTRAGMAELRGEHERAMHYFRGAIRATPDEDLAQPEIASVLEALDATEREAALARGLAALQAAPDNPERHYNYGILLALTGRSDEAVDQLLQTIALGGDHLQAYVNLGFLLIEQGHLDKAIDASKRALAMEPVNLRAQFNLGLALHLQNRHAEAAEHLRRTLTAEPPIPGARAYLALTLLAMQEMPEAVAVMKDCMRTNPQNHTMANVLAGVLATHPDPSLRDPAAAVHYAEMANALTGHVHPPYLNSLAAAYAAAGDFARALTTARKARALALPHEGANGPLVSEIASRIKLYEQGKPYIAAATAGPETAPSTP